WASETESSPPEQITMVFISSPCFVRVGCDRWRVSIQTALAWQDRRRAGIMGFGLKQFRAYTNTQQAFSNKASINWRLPKSDLQNASGVFFDGL
ncbi:MAG: hypothetical protein P8L32_06015, partial [Paracoccaceae bacterium]|nr:hypothetical protein [Paracoccaceae bacterium]